MPKPSSKPKRSEPELELTAALLQSNAPAHVEEYRFDEPKPGIKQRLWRFDFAWPALKVAVEVEGGVFSRGRHVRPAGFIADCEKYSAAAVQGWLVLRVVPRKGWLAEVVPLITKALEMRS